MSQQPVWRRYLRLLGPNFDADVQDELQFHLEMRAGELENEGWSPEAARREAERVFGDMQEITSECRRIGHRRLRAMRRTSLFGEIRGDLKFAARMALKNRVLSAVIVTSLALGIGANTAVFSTVNVALIRSIPFADPDRLVAGEKTLEGAPYSSVSRLDFFDLSDSARSFEGLAAYTARRGTITGGAEPEVASVMFATWNLFPVLGVDPVVGRQFLREEELEGGGRSAMISHGLWRRRFGGDIDVVGQTLFFNGEAHTIVGVVPAGFRFMFDADLWLPIERGDFFIDRTRDSHSLEMVGRLKPGISLLQAQNEIDAIAAMLEEQYPDTNTGKGVILYDLQSYMVGDARISLYLLMATTLMVLLIACSNVAGLLLARGQRRLPEMAMRNALGASRKRLLRQLLTETVFIAMVAGIAGVGLAVLLQVFLSHLFPVGKPGLQDPSIDSTVLLFTLLLSILAGTVGGMIPALQATSFNPWEKLKSVSQVSDPRGSSRTQAAIVVTQVAISVVLLIGSALLIRTMVRLTTVDLGFDPENLLAGVVEIRASLYETREQRSLFFSTLVERVEALPGVESVSTVSKLPIASPAMDWLVWRADQPRPMPGKGRTALARFATPGYFETIGIPLVLGRDIEKSDDPDGAKVMVISQAVADGLFPNQNSVGRMVNIGWNDPYEIVGVVENAKLNGVRSDFSRAMYLPSAQVGPTAQWLVVRTEGDPLLSSDSIRRILHEMDRDVVFSDPKTMSSVVASNLSGSWSVTNALGLLAAIALALTGIGLYGMVAYQVNQRIGEFGIRVALGAPTQKILHLVVARGVRVVAVGLLLGLGLSVFGTRVVKELLFETDPLDPVAFLGATVFLGCVAMIACVLPAWQAVRVNPVEVLRKE